CLQAVCAHVFSNKRRTNDTLSPGIVDGEKEGKKPRGIAATKVYAQRWNQFAYHFRLHVPNPPDPIVAEALALIPRRFKDLTKDELLELTRQIHETLARGIEMPKQDPNAKPEEPEEPEDEKKQPEPKHSEAPASGEAGKEEPKPEPEEDTPADEGWNVRKLLTSKWMLAPLALFVGIWVLLLLQGGLKFWVQVAIMCVLAAGALTAFLYLRRAYIKALLEAFKARASGSRGPAGPGGVPPPNKLAVLLKTRQVRIALLAMAGAGVLYGVYRFSPNIGLGMAGLAVEVELMIGAMSVASRLQDKTCKDKTPISKLARIGVAMAAVLAIGGLVFTLSALGLSDVLVSWVVGVIGCLLLLLLLLFLSKSRKGGSEESGYRRESFWRQLK